MHHACSASLADRSSIKDSRAPARNIVNVTRQICDPAVAGSEGAPVAAAREAAGAAGEAAAPDAAALLREHLRKEIVHRSAAAAAHAAVRAPLLNLLLRPA